MNASQCFRAQALEFVRWARTAIAAPRGPGLSESGGGGVFGLLGLDGGDGLGYADVFPASAALYDFPAGRDRDGENPPTGEVWTHDSNEVIGHKVLQSITGALTTVLAIIGTIPSRIQPHSWGKFDVPLTSPPPSLTFVRYSPCPPRPSAGAPARRGRTFVRIKAHRGCRPAMGR